MTFLDQSFTPTYKRRFSPGRQTESARLSVSQPGSFDHRLASQDSIHSSITDLPNELSERIHRKAEAMMRETVETEFRACRNRTDRLAFFLRYGTGRTNIRFLALLCTYANRIEDEWERLTALRIFLAHLPIDSESIGLPSFPSVPARLASAEPQARVLREDNDPRNPTRTRDVAHAELVAVAEDIRGGLVRAMAYESLLSRLPQNSLHAVYLDLIHKVENIHNKDFRRIASRALIDHMPSPRTREVSERLERHAYTFADADLRDELIARLHPLGQVSKPETFAAIGA